MMLVRSSIDDHLSSVPDHGKQEILCVWIPGDEHKNKDDSLCSRNFLSSSQLTTEVNMPETSKPNLVYKRRMIQKSSTPTLVYKRKKVQSVCCSSSKSNMEPVSVSLKDQTDDVGECSSSVVETNSCIAFLGHHLVLERSKRMHSNKLTDVEKNIFGLRACKVCDRSTLTLKMLICDLCEESFHMSCCNPVVKKIPVGDWFCHSCLRKKLKKMKETSPEKSPKGYFGPIEAMLRDVDSYKSDVRIGKDFQAEVPDWSGLLINELNAYSEPMEISPSDCASSQEWDSSKLSRLSSIGNWLQCREIVDHVNGTVCGKWRRAPLFEAQTDNWECFSSVLWDPTHADCAVPQELDTNQVLKQLKYIEMVLLSLNCIWDWVPLKKLKQSGTGPTLNPASGAKDLRPRLLAKKLKLGVQKGVDQEEHTGDPRNTQKP